MALDMTLIVDWAVKLQHKQNLLSGLNLYVVLFLSGLNSRILLHLKESLFYYLLMCPKTAGSMAGSIDPVVSILCYTDCLGLSVRCHINTLPLSC